jgi:hypothetical protein
MTAMAKQITSGAETFFINKQYSLNDKDFNFIISPLQKDIIDNLIKKGTMNRVELVKATGKPRTTIYDNAMKLYKHDVLKKFPRPKNDIGRPVIYFKLTKKFKKALRKI